MSSDHSFLCIGFTPYTHSSPSLAEPIFSRSGSNEIFCQEIDEVTNKITGFRVSDAIGNDLRLVTTAIKVSDNFDPIYCVYFEDRPAAIGTEATLRPLFQSLLADGNNPAGLRLQISELIGSGAARRQAKEDFDKNVSKISKESGLAYHRSIARVSLWRRLSAAALNEEARKKFISHRSFADVDVNHKGVISVDLDELSPDDFPGLDFSTLALEIEQEIGRYDFATNDNGEHGITIIEQEITPDSLRFFLNRIVGRDGRITRPSYFRTARLLGHLGFVSLEQVEDAVRKYDGLMMGYIVFGNRQGQITRFELMLLAALGEHYITNTPWSSSNYYVDILSRRLEIIERADIKTRTFDIRSDTENRVRSGYVLPSMEPDQPTFL